MDVLLYTWSHCRFCAQAKALLERREVAYREEVLDDRPALRRRLQAHFDRRTMPLILIDGECVGGLTELEALEAAGGLGELSDGSGSDAAG